MDGRQAVVPEYGGVGSAAERTSEGLGAKVIAASDADGGLFNSNGLDVNALHEHVRRGNPVPEFEEGDKIDNSDLLELQCDMLIPAAIENVITTANAPRIKAKIIVEAANQPITAEADEMLNDMGVIIVTDILAMIDKFANRAGAPAKARADLEPAALDMKINISDVTFGLDGFRGLPYYFAPPAAGPCP